MPHIHTEPGQIDHTVTAFIVRTDLSEPKVLLHMHKKYNLLMPVGGHVELDETPWAAVLHEVQEESGYDVSQLHVLQPELRIEQMRNVVPHPQPLCMNTHRAASEHFHSDTIYLLTVTEDPEHSLAEGESEDIRWLSRTEVAELADGQMFADAKQTALQIFDSFLGVWQPVAAAEYSNEKVLNSEL